MKKFILILCCAFLSISAFSQSKIGTIDAEYIVVQMPEMSEVNQGLEAYDKELQAELKANIDAYETLVKNYQETNTALSDEDKQAKETEIISLENDIKGFRQKAGVLMQVKRNELTKPLYERINTAMLEIIKEEGYTQIFHAGGASLAYSAEGSDITMEVLNKLGIEVKE